ncbi:MULTISPECIES: hypothetical protein [unclassified Roseofilum]|uniref:hypothetical protein n=1 Tax=unclassified Roseofilum TaxID=2620099 RepID=UPI001B2076CF|nr:MULTISPECIES: hypothetical protein [unclassified Roseofilum]MBP0010565.1 hypothetical protein [Roseofilum sp. Belize Diploria]MBP0035011.1 hypothetical protein [Roseofilum sp. Belize BBD 4]
MLPPKMLSIIPVLRDKFSQIDNPEEAIDTLVDIAKDHGIDLNNNDLDFVMSASKSGYDRNHLNLDSVRWGLFSLIRVACVSAQRQTSELDLVEA